MGGPRIRLPSFCGESARLPELGRPARGTLTPALSSALGKNAAFVIAAVLIVVGVLFVGAGRTVGPQDDADAEAFRSDPSCTAGVAARVSAGACRWERVTIVAVETRASSPAKPRSRQPYVTLRRADGTTVEAQLAGAAGRAFAGDGFAGAPARALFFRATLVRLVAASGDAQTLRAPSVEASNVRSMTWVGAGALAFGIVIAALGYLARLWSRLR